MQDISFSQLANLLPKQKQALDIMMLCKYLLYGGAASGGKSYFLRWAALYLVMYYCAKYNLTGVRVGLFCEDYPALNERQLSKIPYEFPSYLGILNKQSHEFRLNPEYGGGVIAFRNLDDPSKYLSSEFAAILVDEASKNVRETFDFLVMRMRWPGIPDTKFIGATNPGGPGHGWIKKLWIDKDFTDEQLDPSEFQFVQAKYTDNSHIDASYAKQLNSLPEQMRRAYMEGDWDVFKGQFFSEFRREFHVIEPFNTPEDKAWFDSLPTYCGLDYGYNAPSAVVWGKYHDETWYIYRELYQNGLTYEELRDKIMSIEIPDRIFADPSIWAKKDSPTSGADRMTLPVGTGENIQRLVVKPAMNDRVIGWTIIKQSLKVKKIKIFSTCKDLIRTIPIQVYDERNGHMEDLDTTGDDHIVDALRYLIATHKHIIPQKEVFTYNVLHGTPKVIREKTADEELDALFASPDSTSSQLDPWQKTSR